MAATINICDLALLSLNKCQLSKFTSTFNFPCVGVGPAYDRVGTKDTIMIRVPDHTVTAHLCNITGPLAITSANPSGEPDSTHHSMVIKSVSPQRTELKFSYTYFADPLHTVSKRMFASSFRSE